MNGSGAGFLNFYLFGYIFLFSILLGNNRYHKMVFTYHDLEGE